MQNQYVYERMTKLVIEQLKKGVVPWRKPWRAEAGPPKNLVSKREYRGVNLMVLSLLGYQSPYFLSINQANKLGGKVRRGEHGCPVVFWKWPEKEDDVRVDDEHTESDSSKKGTPNPSTKPMLRVYHVFNVAQCEGVRMPGNTETEPKRKLDPVLQAETIALCMPDKPTVRYGFKQAAYNPKKDSVQMPDKDTFCTSEAYYCTLFHELVHSTGHARRLNRKGLLSSKFGSETYSREELIAEMGACFLCGHAGIDDAVIESSAGYINGWLERLKSDQRLVVSAAGAAQKAADFILGGSAAPKS
jgi:antirestriction protein ArdC